MAQDNKQKLKGAQSRQDSNFRLWMWVLLLAGILLVSGAVGLKHVYSESKKELLILQIGQNVAAAGAQPSANKISGGPS
jgi:hypothetical protein